MAMGLGKGNKDGRKDGAAEGSKAGLGGGAAKQAAADGANAAQAADALPKRSEAAKIRATRVLGSFFQSMALESLEGRLGYVKRDFGRVLIAGADGGLSLAAWARRCPKAKIDVMEPKEDLAQIERNALPKRPAWARARPKLRVLAGVSSLDAPGPNDEPYDALWCNLALPRLDRPPYLKALGAWRERLKNDGMVFFSHFGPGTLNEWIEAMQKVGVGGAVRREALCDILELGDAMVEAGFYDPVCDVESTRCEYKTARGLWRDLGESGLLGALAPGVEDQSALRAATERAFENGDLGAVTYELVYGHGLRRPEIGDATAPVSFFKKRPG